MNNQARAPFEFTTPFDADAVMNQCLDLEAEGRTAEARDLVTRATSHDAEFEQKLLKMCAAVGQLRGLPQAPNVAPAVLAEVDYLRPFLSLRRRRQLSATRVAVAAGIVVTFSLMAVLQRIYPEATSLGSDSSPIGEVVDASRADAAASMRSMVTAVNELREGVSKPMAQPSGPARRARVWNSGVLTMGDTSRYDSGTNWSKELALGPTRPWSGMSPPLAPLASAELADLQTGPAMLTLRRGGGLFEHPSVASILPSMDPGQDLLNLDDKLGLGGRRLLDLGAGRQDHESVHPATQ